MDFQSFQSQAFSVVSAIEDSLVSNPPRSELGAPPADWPALRSIVRAFADELMLCPSVDRAIARLRGDQSLLLSVVWLAIDIDDASILEAMGRAYVALGDDAPGLPCRPFAAYLIELCDGLELVRLNP